MVDPSAFTPVDFARLPGWATDDHAAAFAAFARSAHRVLIKPYRTGSLGIACAAFDRAYEEARNLGQIDRSAARDFFERHFVPHRVTSAPGAASGFVTGFYEPQVAASPVKTDEFRYPLLERPDDLVDVDDGNRPAGMDHDLAFTQNSEHSIIESHHI